MYFCAVCQLSKCSGSSLGHALWGMLMKNDSPLLHAMVVPPPILFPQHRQALTFAKTLKTTTKTTVPA